jgi:hypothetical protein
MASRAAALVTEIIDRIDGRALLSTGRPPMPTIKIVEALRFVVREGVPWRELRATDMPLAFGRLHEIMPGSLVACAPEEVTS